MMVAGSVFLLAISVAGCGSKTKIEDNPETIDNLNKCQANLKEKVEYINTLNERITALENGVGGSPEGAVVVNIEGAMEIKIGKNKGPNAGSGNPKGTAKDAELYEAFVSQLKRSRGAIKKCYQHALKKNSALAGRSVTLNIGVDYKTSGKVKTANFTPRVSEQFNQCMDGVAKNWTLPGMPRAVSFNYKQTLTPE
jgi:outer membrane murein-binding lipoprotein Lpp